MFQSTHPHGVRQPGQYDLISAITVSIHAPAWGATERTPDCSICARCFNPRTRMGCDRPLTPDHFDNIGFNPRTRMGCDKSSKFSGVPITVSIHAPAWGATNLLKMFIGLPSFQSTHPHGVRQIDPREPGAALWVSIHAPAWGATKVARIRPAPSKFQSTHPHGVRLPVSDGTVELYKFQSTHPHGVRLVPVRYRYFNKGFNPRTRMGCDLLQTILFCLQTVSIHAPAWGATGGAGA